MKIAIFKNRAKKSQVVADSLISKINASKVLEVDNNNPEIVISVGGDGTLLSAFHHYKKIVSQVRFVGIHTGHLGFYTDWRDFEVNELISSLENDDGQSVTYPLLQIVAHFKNSDREIRRMALNESTIKQISGTMVADVYIGDHHFEKFRGDGLCISTPSGSTAYNKSVGGAIIDPKLNVLQVAEIASINNRVFRTLGSPLIVEPNERVEIVPVNKFDLVLSCDDRVMTTEAIDSVEFKIATEKIAFATYRHAKFWQRVSNSFIGEI